MANGSVSAIVKSKFAIGLAPQTQLSMIDWIGPSSYTQVTPGTPPSAGDQVTAFSFGLKAIDCIVGGGSADGNFEIVPIRLNATTWILEWRSLVTATVGGQSQVTGTQATAATSLTASKVRLCAIGV